ncbi:MAK32 protein [Histoplasma capsulatum]|uniref:MAK32 protein n=1 Tax=Ajellomyces capsulatus TaxID=5037 RepID=A0A8A1M146_AJECA|nr:MAK32 protein [Histoplasma capsulatum]
MSDVMSSKSASNLPLGSNISFCTLGMFIIDEIEFPAPRPLLKNIIGGAGAYAAVGARMLAGKEHSRSTSGILHQNFAWIITLFHNLRYSPGHSTWSAPLSAAVRLSRGYFRDGKRFCKASRLNHLLPSSVQFLCGSRCRIPATQRSFQCSIRL